MATTASTRALKSEIGAPGSSRSWTKPLDEAGDVAFHNRRDLERRDLTRKDLILFKIVLEQCDPMGKDLTFQKRHVFERCGPIEKDLTRGNSKVQRYR